MGMLDDVMMFLARSIDRINMYRSVRKKLQVMQKVMSHSVGDVMPSFNRKPLGHGQVYLRVKTMTQPPNSPNSHFAYVLHAFGALCFMFNFVNHIRVNPVEPTSEDGCGRFPYNSKYQERH